MASNASFNIAVNFAPSGEISAKAATLNIASNATNNSAGVVNLSGNALPIPMPIVRLSATLLGFGNTIIGGATPSQRLTIINIGLLPLNIVSIVSPGDFAATHQCPMTLLSSQSS